MLRKTPVALVAASVLLVGVGAGSATAGALITGKDIKNGTVTGKDIKAGSLQARQVKDGSLTGADVKNGSLGEADLAGGVKAKLNAPAVSGYEVVTSTTEIPTDGEGVAYVACTAGKLAVGGGGGFTDLEITNAIEQSVPQTVIRGDALLFDDAQPGFADGWKVHGKHGGLEAEELTAYVICVDPS
jgi:hypothetical protein